MFASCRKFKVFCTSLTGAVERKRILIYLMIIKSSDYSTMLATCIWLGTNHNNFKECTNIEIAAYLRLQHANVQANYKSLFLLLGSAILTCNHIGLCQLLSRALRGFLGRILLAHDTIVRSHDLSL